MGFVGDLKRSDFLFLVVFPLEVENKHDATGLMDDKILGRISRRFSLGRGLRGDQEFSGGIMYPLWPGNNSVSPQEELESVTRIRDV